MTRWCMCSRRTQRILAAGRSSSPGSRTPGSTSRRLRTGCCRLKTKRVPSGPAEQQAWKQRQQRQPLAEERNKEEKHWTGEQQQQPQSQV
mmetsp:Transcript_34972/g.103615  ORF Transcript_34972/g.103615 Transcript_34972/m.103615 type:complete len:90 (+) Transcript_34972:849-1118(+)